MLSVLDTAAAPPAAAAAAAAATAAAAVAATAAAAGCPSRSVASKRSRAWLNCTCNTHSFAALARMQGWPSSGSSLLGLTAFAWIRAAPIASFGVRRAANGPPCAAMAALPATACSYHQRSPLPALLLPCHCWQSEHVRLPTLSLQATCRSSPAAGQTWWMPGQ